MESGWNLWDGGVNKKFRRENVWRFGEGGRGKIFIVSGIKT